MSDIPTPEQLEARKQELDRIAVRRTGIFIVACFVLLFWTVVVLALTL